MCWSASASVAMVAAGSAAAALSWRRGDAPAIWATLAYFTIMEALQAVGYSVVDQCSAPENRTVTLLSYIHIALQPLVLNAFAMEIAPQEVPRHIRRRVLVAAGFMTLLILGRLLPWDALGQCRPGLDVMCGTPMCLVSGDWHIGWQLPLTAQFQPFAGALGVDVQFPAYLVAVFLFPLFYGAWRFVAMHTVAGPALAMLITDDPREMPAVWCLFSIGILLITLSPSVRYRAMRAHRPRAA
ncbi:DUF5765 domain-containing protein [Tropicimonas marinistellae]|uniref:DUF5765 domain-containing protein n=1 Tax=Tropicimonas marinistellae TaxID=1739787 RepID=UPI000829F87B|nr:DUF5765 domain-containing protein [Tropicimonas marinistellae]